MLLLRRTSRAMVWSLAWIVAACAEPAPRPARTAASDPSPAAAPVVTPVAYRAIGTEPFWALAIGQSGLRLTTPEDTAGARWAGVAPAVEGVTLHWSASGPRGAIDARLWPARCSDGMSDRVWTY